MDIIPFLGNDGAATGSPFASAKLELHMTLLMAFLESNAED
jgi:hypothetical protein